MNFKHVLVILAATSALALASILASCTDTDRASIEALGRPGHIECWSGEHKIYEGKASGRIQTVQNSDGWEFKEKGTGAFVRVSGPCVIRN